MILNWVCHSKLVISVWYLVDGHEAQVVLLTIRQHKTHVSNERHETNYSRFLGCGPPHYVLEGPEDIFVDITEGAYGIFVKEASHWVEWISVIKLIGRERHSGLTMLLHPQNARLMVQCTKQEVLWIDCAKLTAAHRALFAQHPCQSIITAREMIEESPALVTEIGDMYKMEQEWQRELERKLASAYWYCDLLSPPTVWGLCDFSGPKEVKRNLHPCHLNT